MFHSSCHPRQCVEKKLDQQKHFVWKSFANSISPSPPEITEAGIIYY